MTESIELSDNETSNSQLRKQISQKMNGRYENPYTNDDTLFFDPDGKPSNFNKGELKALNKELQSLMIIVNGQKYHGDYRKQFKIGEGDAVVIRTGSREVKFEMPEKTPLTEKLKFWK